MTSQTTLYRALVRDAMQTDCGALAEGASCGEAIGRLREGVEALSTLGRMDSLAEAGYLDHDEHDYLGGAYHHLCRLILRHQVAAARDGQEVSYYVAPERLTRREKDMLVDGLKAIRRFRDRVRAELTGDIF